MPAAKTEVLLEDLGELVGEGHQALVFSQFTTFLEQNPDSSGRGRDPLRVPGRAYQESRTGDPAVSGQDRFGIPHQPEGGRLRAQPRGGRLLLCIGSVVEPSYRRPRRWIVRIGSAKPRPCMVYRLVAKDTIEQKVMDLKAQKEELFSAVVGGEALAAGSTDCRGNPRASRQLAMCCSVMRAMQCEVTRGLASTTHTSAQCPLFDMSRR